jgi:biopolymer transport protein ExbD
LSPKGEIFVNQRKVTEESFGKRRFKKFSNNNANKTVILRGDKDVLLGETVKVMSINQARRRHRNRHRRRSRAQDALKTVSRNFLF